MRPSLMFVDIIVAGNLTFLVALIPLTRSDLFKHGCCPPDKPDLIRAHTATIKFLLPAPLQLLVFNFSSWVGRALRPYPRFILGQFKVAGQAIPFTVLSLNTISHAPWDHLANSSLNN